MPTSNRPSAITRLTPGVIITAGIAAVSWLVAEAESRKFGHPVVEGLVVAMLIGVAVRALWTPGTAADPGIRFASKELLELAVCLMGLAVDLPLLLAAGPALAAGIVLLVIVGLTLSYALGRLLGLPHKLAVLVSAGNAICGNSAIVAVAPVIGADAEDVGSAIAFTAILGVAVVLGLPQLVGPLGLSEYQYGVLAGLTVYAVPQVLAAAFPVSALSGQVGTLVKLVRVLMLGPVVLFFAVREKRTQAKVAAADANGATPLVASARRTGVARVTQYVPWFIIGFLLLAGVRSIAAVPASVVTLAHSASAVLTLLAMAALGLNCDLRAVMKAGGAVIATVCASLAALIALSVALIHLLGIR